MTLTLENLASHAEQRLSAAADMVASDDARLTCHLPHLTLDIHSLDAEFHRLCKRALVQLDQRDALSEAAKVVITCESATPSLSMPDWQGQTPGLGDIYERLEAQALDCSYEIDHQSWQFYSSIQKQGIYLLREAKDYAPWEAAFPLRNFLHWQYASQGRRLIHAASLGIGQTGVLLAGAGGAGKSGTTLAGILHGLQSCGDDYIGIEVDEAGVHAFPVMRLMKQDPKGFARLGINANEPTFGSLNWQGKYEFDFEELSPNSRANRLDIKAVFLPHIGSSQSSSIRPASAREVLFALLPNNLQQLPGRYKQGFNIISQISRQIKGYHLELSQDPKEISATIVEFLLKDMP